MENLKQHFYNHFVLPWRLCKFSAVGIKNIVIRIYGGKYIRK